MNKKRCGSGVGGRNVEKNVFVMKCNKNANIPYCGEYYQWILDSVALLVSLQ